MSVPGPKHDQYVFTIKKMRRILNFQFALVIWLLVHFSTYLSANISFVSIKNPFWFTYFLPSFRLIQSINFILLHHILFNYIFYFYFLFLFLILIFIIFFKGSGSPASNLLLHCSTILQELRNSRFLLLVELFICRFKISIRLILRSHSV